MKAAFQFVQCALDRGEYKAYFVLAGRNGNRSENHIGAHNRLFLPIDSSPPPRVPDIIQNQHTAIRGIDIDDHFLAVTIFQTGIADAARRHFFSIFWR